MNRFYFGVVEDRSDPLMLGRCRVRVFSIHSEDKLLVPTEDLPWAMPLQPITSAAMNGIGSSPVGPVEGTWVLVSFIDDGDFQQPLIMGSLGAIPSDRANIFELDEEQVVIDSASGKVSDGSVQGTTAKSGQLNVIGGTLTNDGNIVNRIPGIIQKSDLIGPLDSNDISKLSRTLLNRESSGNYGAINQYQFIGGYQFGALMLIDIGYVKASYRKNSKLVETDAWTGKNGITSRDQFLSNTSVQDSSIVEEFKLNWKRLKRLGVVNENTTKKEAAGLLCSAHLVGASGAANLVKGQIKKDGNGVSSKEYYDLGYSCIDGDLPVMFPTTDISSDSRSKNESAEAKTLNKQIEILNKTRFGFKDPNGKYPKQDFIKEPDTSRLARGQSVKKTIVAEKEIARQTGIPKANNKGHWNQPIIPYNAKYPYNHVSETESGHVMEFDDSPGAERINLWHTKGTYTEIDANGTQVNRIVGDGFWILERDGNVHITGACNITIDGSANVYVQNDADIQVDGDINLKCFNDVKAEVSGKFDLSIGEQFNIKAAEFNVETHTGDINMVSASNIKSKASVNVDTKASGNINSDATNIHMNSGTSTNAIPNGLTRTGVASYMPRDVFTPVALPNLDSITTYKDTQEIKYELDEFSYNEYLLEQDDNDQVSVTPTIAKTDNTSITPVKPITYSNGLLDTEIFPMDLQLTPNFKLGQLVICPASSGPNPLIKQHGITQRNIAYNLQQLAYNCLEPIIKKYPDMIITSGLRSVHNGSQHEKGQAVDIQFTGISDSEYFTRAVEIKKLIPFDQLILEYKDTGSKKPWIHISYNPNGLRGNIFTYFNHSKLDNNLVQLG